jgi:hypothetical protein
MVSTGPTRSLWHFENEEFVFSAVHHAFRFCLLYEGKYFHQYNHRWSTYSSGIESEVDVSDVDLADPHVLLQPRYWFPANAATDRFSKKWGRPWALVWRDIARSTDERTMIATIIPSLAVAHTATLLFVAPEFVPSIHCLVANLNSMAFDFVTRQKVGGIHLSAFILEQLPVVPQSEYSQVLAGDVASLSEWIRPRDMEGFASDIGYAGPPFRWDPERRAILRAELDAAFFHLYGLDADDTAYILDTFPVLRDKEVRQFGEYRTRRLVLERYAALATAIATRTPYVSPLSPPPASPLAAHQYQSRSLSQSSECCSVPLSIRPHPPMPSAIEFGVACHARLRARAATGVLFRTHLMGHRSTSRTGETMASFVVSRLGRRLQLCAAKRASPLARPVTSPQRPYLSSHARHTGLPAQRDTGHAPTSASRIPPWT